MLNNINFYGKINTIKNKRQSTKPIMPTGQDVFIKGCSVEKDNKSNRRKIVDILSQNKFDEMMVDLVDTSSFTNGYDRVSFLENKTMGRYVGMMIENFETAIPERHNYSYNEFCEIISDVLASSIESNPEKKEEYVALYNKLIKKLEEKGN